MRCTAKGKSRVQRSRCVLRRLNVLCVLSVHGAVSDAWGAAREVIVPRRKGGGSWRATPERTSQRKQQFIRSKSVIITPACLYCQDDAAKMASSSRDGPAAATQHLTKKSNEFASEAKSGDRKLGLYREKYTPSRCGHALAFQVGMQTSLANLADFQQGLCIVSADSTGHHRY